MINIYSKPNCVQCLQAAAMLRAKGIEFKELKVSVDYELDYLTDLCAELGKPAPRSFPVLIKDDVEYIGDLQELKQKLAQGLV